MRRPPDAPAAAPDAASLHDAALRHLSRYAATQAGLVRVLDRRVARWARAANAPPEQVAALRAITRQVAARLVSAGAVDDATFAEARAARLARGGRSRRAIAAHLAAKGVAADTGRAALPDDAAELAAAVITLRRRRLGAFGPPATDAQARHRQLAALARAGFAQSVARQALALSREEAESLLLDGSAKKGGG